LNLLGVATILEDCLLFPSLGKVGTRFLANAKFKAPLDLVCMASKNICTSKVIICQGVTEFSRLDLALWY
jgi:hypothetical protein